MTEFDLRPVDYHHPDAQALIAQVQLEYVRRYGGPDGTPVDHAEFRPPTGHFVVGYDNDQPVAMGGWRFTTAAPPLHGTPLTDLNALATGRNLTAEPQTDPNPGTAELKRMYVIPAARGRGLARTVLTHLERTAAEAGATVMVLETGLQQPEAIALYRSCGYQPIPAFGHYADSPSSVHLGKRLHQHQPATAGPSTSSTDKS